jgi:hypothetical protein
MASERYHKRKESTEDIRVGCLFAMSDSAAAATASVFARDSREQSVLVADGYGLALTVDRGHLLIRDGLGRHRRDRRLPRAQRDVERIVVLGHTGPVTSAWKPFVGAPTPASPCCRSTPTDAFS